MSESVPSSTTGFAHRRARADSTASFTYYEENEESPESSTWPDDDVVIDEEEVDEDGLDGSIDEIPDSRPKSPRRRKSSAFSRLSVEDPLLRRHDSSKTDTSGYAIEGRTNQKIYITTEDLTVVFAGFKTSLIGFTLYMLLCIVSLGLGYLIFRWLPRWKVWLTGTVKPLRECTWVVIEVRSIGNLLKLC